MFRRASDSCEEWSTDQRCKNKARLLHFAAPFLQPFLLLITCEKAWDCQWMTAAARLLISGVTVTVTAMAEGTQGFHTFYRWVLLVTQRSQSSRLPKKRLASAEAHQIHQLTLINISAYKYMYLHNEYYIPTYVLIFPVCTFARQKKWFHTYISQTTKEAWKANRERGENYSPRGIATK